MNQKMATALYLYFFFTDSFLVDVSVSLHAGLPLELILLTGHSLWYAKVIRYFLSAEICFICGMTRL